MTQPESPYNIPEFRDLSDQERDLLVFILGQVAPARLSEIEELKVIARCGCGNCPTVMFGTTGDASAELRIRSRELASYIGVADEGVLVGVALLERGAKCFELEAWSPAGEDIASWPKLSSLKPVE